MTSSPGQLLIGLRRRGALLGALIALLSSASIATECRAGVIVPSPRETIADGSLSVEVDRWIDDTGSSTRLDALVAGLREHSHQERAPVRPTSHDGLFDSSGETSSPLVSATGQTTFLACASFESRVPVGADSHFTGRLREWDLLLPEAPCLEMLDPPRA